MEPFYEKVLAYMRQQGPVLPTQVAKVLEKDTFYAGAILSDLLSKKIIRITTAKLGGSPVYYLPEHQEKLSLLYQHLPMREKEAYDMLKEHKILKDEETQPAIRVALKALKDFAVPVQIGNTFYWRWHLEPETASPAQEPKVAEAQVQLVTSQKQETQPQITAPQRSVRKRKVEDEFLPSVESYLRKSNIASSSLVSQRKNQEAIFVASIPSAIGQLDMLVVAKNKKKIGDNDLSLAHQKGQHHKMPVIFLSAGELTKKAQQHIEKNLKGYLIFKRL